MGLFPRFDEEERSPDAPRKTGFPRFWQILRRDIWDIFKAGFLALLGSLPFLAGVFFAAGTHAVLTALLAGLIGLIPNCASSVAITQLYALGGLGLGGAVAGLSVNAGLGYAVLFKENRNWKENLLIVVGLFALTVAVGEAVALLWN